MEFNMPQLIRYDMGCAQYSDFLYKAQLLTQNLLKQGYVAHMLMSSIYNSTIVITNQLAVTKYPFVIWQWIISLLRRPFLYSITENNFTGLYYMRNTVDILQEMITVHPQRTPDFLVGPCCSSFQFSLLHCFVCLRSVSCAQWCLSVWIIHF